MVQENEREIGVFGHLDNFMRSTANFATFGMADVIAGTLNANLLRSTSCSSIANCIQKELKDSFLAASETPITTALGAVAGTTLMAFLPIAKLQQASKLKYKDAENFEEFIKKVSKVESEKFYASGEHLLALGSLNALLNLGKLEIGRFDSSASDTEIKVPKFPNIAKEELGNIRK